MKILHSGKSLISIFLHPQLQATALLLLMSDTVYARIPISIPEPSILSLAAGGLVVGIIIHRIKNRKK